MAFDDPVLPVRVIRGDARQMTEIDDASIDLIVTSPPYWDIKDYGISDQIGHGQSLHEYLHDLYRVWHECFRVLKPGRRLCVNIGDQFARALIYGRYKIIPLHAEVIAQTSALGLDYMGSIIWQKKTTMNTTGGAVVMGSFPHPPNGIVELDYEFILLFKKPGKSVPPTAEQKAASALTTDEWKEYFSGHWHFGGVRQQNHKAMFPDELPRRLIRMFSFAGEMVLDPFLGSGTTAKVAHDLGRESTGYEINADFLSLIREKVGLAASFEEQKATSPQFEEQKAMSPQKELPIKYTPLTEEARPQRDAAQFRFGKNETYRVTEIIDEQTLLLDTGLKVQLLGIAVSSSQREPTREYLCRYLRGKSVIVRLEQIEGISAEERLPAYVQLSNKLFVNRKMIEMGLATADRTVWHRMRDKFIAAEMSVGNAL